MIEQTTKASFQASYAYGPAEEHVKTPSRLIASLKTLLFTGTSLIKTSKSDTHRLLTQRKQLQLLGGEPVVLKTPDGENLPCFYISALKFKKAVERYLYKYDSVNADGTITDLLLVKPLYTRDVLQKQGEGKPIFHYKQPIPEAMLFLEILKDLCGQTVPYKVIKGNPDVKEYALEIGEYDVQLPLASMQDHSPTALITENFQLPGTSYKNLMGSYLLSGMNVMLVDLRSYGRSGLRPFNTNLDLDTAYQYLQKEKKLKNEDLLVHSHSLYAESVLDLAARRSGVNVLLDKNLAGHPNKAHSELSFIKKMITVFTPSPKNLQKIKGQIALDIDEGMLDRFLDQLHFRRRLF